MASRLVDQIIRLEELREGHISDTIPELDSSIAELEEYAYMQFSDSIFLC